MKLEELLNSYNDDGSAYYEIEITVNGLSFKWKGKYPSIVLNAFMLDTKVNNWGINGQEREIFVILEDCEELK